MESVCLPANEQSFYGSFSHGIATRAKSPEHNVSFGYESLIVPAWSMIILSPMNKLILCKVKSSDSNMTVSSQTS